MSALPSPEEQGAALSSLKHHPGWPVFCAHFGERMDLVRDQAMEAKTDEEANRLRAAHQKLREFEPGKLREQLEKNARIQARRANDPQPMV